jgi:UDP-2,4-diacetamido-2,4,6-trideoxy-beta-L-altropyranose hydrolase
MRLRRACIEDSRLLWEWVNDPDVRAASFSSAPIPWESHVAWFAGKLGQDRGLIFIAEDEDATPSGQIRFDARPDGEWEVDISVAKKERGKGLASELVRLGVRAIREEGRGVRIHALVKPANNRSLKAFERAKFKPIGIEHVRGNTAIHLIYEEAEPTSSRNLAR